MGQTCIHNFCLPVSLFITIKGLTKDINYNYVKSMVLRVDVFFIKRVTNDIILIDMLRKLIEYYFKNYLSLYLKENIPIKINFKNDI